MAISKLKNGKAAGKIESQLNCLKREEKSSGRSFMDSF
jgi:hypothetical protein